MKKLAIVILVFLVIAIGIVYYFRHEIFQYSAEALIQKNLPPFVTVEGIVFDLKEGLLEVKGFGVKNPRGYKNKYLAKNKIYHLPV